MIPIAGDSVSLNDRQHLEYRLGEIAEKIKDQGRKRRLLAEVLRHAKNEDQPLVEEDGDILEPELVYPVEDAPLDDLVVAGVDGGVLSKPLHGLDLILVRAVAAIFKYEGGNLREADYHPGEMPVPQLINVHEPVDSRELDVLVGLRRQETELDRAREAIVDRDIDALMLDGSVLPQYINYVSSARTRDLHKGLIDSFKGLYRTCEEEGILLLGVVKDSRSARLANIFRKRILPRVMEGSDLPSYDITSLDENKGVLRSSRDTAFLDYFLEAGERSFSFKYAEAPANFLSDFEGWRNKICAFYLKPAPYDRPTMVEVVCSEEEDLERVRGAASLVNALSANHEACALPSVLIEADARAALAEEEISILRDNIADRLEPSTMLDLRRERRPF